MSYICEDCGKIFIRKCNYYKHIQKCSLKILTDDKKNEFSVNSTKSKSLCTRKVISTNTSSSNSDIHGSTSSSLKSIVKHDACCTDNKQSRKNGCPYQRCYN